MTGDSPLRIDLISDVVCPWCYVGLRALLQAAATPDLPPVSIQPRAYQLDPSTPVEGADRKARLERAFGGDQARLAAATAAVQEAGTEVGITFRFDRIERTPNTLDCHRLIRWASGAGLGLMAAEALFQAYFVEGEDLTRPETLVAIARGLGLDGVLVAELLAGERDREAVRGEIDVARRIGVTGVPCVILDGRAAVIGAQPVEAYVQAIRASLAARSPGSSLA